MERPLLSPVQIARRQQGVADLVEDAITREQLAVMLWRDAGGAGGGGGEP